MNQNFHTISNGITGVLASAAGFAVTWASHLESWVRLTTAVLCLIIAVITLYNLIKGKK